MNDVVVHPNQGELISCDQAGRIKQWDLSDNICTHELVGQNVFFAPTVLLIHWVQTPAGDIPMRSISLAGDGSCLVAGNNKVLCSPVTSVISALTVFKGRCYVWRINDERSDRPRFQAVTKFQAHNKYLTRLLFSPDAKSASPPEV